MGLFPYGVFLGERPSHAALIKTSPTAGFFVIIIVRMYTKQMQICF